MDILSEYKSLNDCVKLTPYHTFDKETQKIYLSSNAVFTSNFVFKKLDEHFGEIAGFIVPSVNGAGFKFNVDKCYSNEIKLLIDDYIKGSLKATVELQDIVRSYSDFGENIIDEAKEQLIDLIDMGNRFGSDYREVMVPSLRCFFSGHSRIDLRMFTAHTLGRFHFHPVLAGPTVTHYTQDDIDATKFASTNMHLVIAPASRSEIVMFFYDSNGVYQTISSKLSKEYDSLMELLPEVEAIFNEKLCKEEIIIRKKTGRISPKMNKTER